MACVGGLPGGPVHLVGIGGYGMRGLARLLLAQGRAVSGEDACGGFAVDALAAEGVRMVGAAGGVPGATACVIHSAAVPQDHPALVCARAASVPCFKYAEALGRCVAPRRVIACAGTHGKSSSTAMLAYLLSRVRDDVGYVIGADPAAGMPDLKTNARAGGLMVVEACEYDRSFLHFSPWGALVTNVEMEHVDVFPTEASLLEAFREFAGRVRADGVIVVPPGLVEPLGLASRTGPRVVTYGAGGLWRAEAGPFEDKGRRVCVTGPGGIAVKLTLSVPGEHHVANLTGVVALACELLNLQGGLSLAGFRGLRRRFEILAEDGPTVVDDYAHHPTEVAATLAAAAERFPRARRIVAVFQPHQRRRLEAFAAPFADALKPASRVLVVPVFAAREDPGACAEASARFARRLARGAFCADFVAAHRMLAADMQAGDVVLCMGAGDITEFAAELASRRCARPLTAARREECAHAGQE